MFIGKGPESVETSMRWSRPPVPPFDPKKDKIVFQQLDVDHYVGKWLREGCKLILLVKHRKVIVACVSVLNQCRLYGNTNIKNSWMSKRGGGGIATVTRGLSV